MAWLRGISQKVAEASMEGGFMEGGFLGVGGVRVSDAEKATLADIAKALEHNRSLRELSDNPSRSVGMLAPRYRHAAVLVNRRWIGTPYRHPKGTPLSGEFGR